MSQPAYPYDEAYEQQYPASPEMMYASEEKGDKKEKKELLRAKVQSLVARYEEERNRNEELTMELERLREQQRTGVQQGMPMPQAQPGMAPGMQPPAPGMQPRPPQQMPGMPPQPGMNQQGMGPQPGMNPQGMGPGMNPQGMGPGMNPQGMGPQPGINPQGMGPGMNPMAQQSPQQFPQMMPGMQPNMGNQGMMPQPPFGQPQGFGQSAGPSQHPQGFGPGSMMPPGVSPPNYSMQNFAGAAPAGMMAAGMPGSMNQQSMQPSPWQQPMQQPMPGMGAQPNPFGAQQGGYQPPFPGNPLMPTANTASLTQSMSRVMQTIEQVRAKLHQTESIRNGHGYPQQPAYVDYDTVNLLDRLYDQLGDLIRELMQQRP